MMTHSRDVRYSANEGPSFVTPLVKTVIARRDRP